MKKFLYVGLLVYVFWMDDEKKDPIFRKCLVFLDWLPHSTK